VGRVVLEPVVVAQEPANFSEKEAARDGGNRSEKSAHDQVVSLRLHQGLAQQAMTFDGRPQERIRPMKPSRFFHAEKCIHRLYSSIFKNSP
jgi:hypothetical protein